MVQSELTFGQMIAQVKPEEHPYSEEYDWKQTRYAGVCPYLITLITQNQCDYPLVEQ